MLGNLFHFQLKKENQDLKGGGKGENAKLNKAEKKKAEKERKEREKEEKKQVPIVRLISLHAARVQKVN